LQQHEVQGPIEARMNLLTKSQGRMQSLRTGDLAAGPLCQATTKTRLRRCQRLSRLLRLGAPPQAPDAFWRRARRRRRLVRQDTGRPAKAATLAMPLATVLEPITTIGTVLVQGRPF